MIAFYAVMCLCFYDLIAHHLLYKLVSDSDHWSLPPVLNTADLSAPGTVSGQLRLELSTFSLLIRVLHFCPRSCVGPAISSLRSAGS